MTLVRAVAVVSVTPACTSNSCCTARRCDAFRGVLLRVRRAAVGPGLGVPVGLQQHHVVTVGQLERR